MSCEEARSKCFHYLNSILRLSPKKSKKGHHSVRALVQKLIDDEIEPEAFVKIVVAVPDIAPTGSQLVSFLKVIVVLKVEISQSDINAFLV